MHSVNYAMRNAQRERLKGEGNETHDKENYYRFVQTIW